MVKRVTVYDIAAELKISPSTVSRVLNNSSLISNERSQQILDTAELLGYKKRTIKKHMNRAILNIHLFLPQTDNTLTHFFYNISELIDAIQIGFGEVKLNFITRVNDGNIEFLEKKKTGQIDGCIFAFTQPNKTLAEKLEKRFIPYILLNRFSERGSSIIYDVPLGIKQLAEELVTARGQTLKPCYIGFRKLPLVSQARFEAADSVFRKHKIKFDISSSLVVNDLNEIHSSGLNWVLKNKFNAVMAFNDIAALSVLQAGLAKGIRFPEDMLLSGCDDSPIQQLLDRRIDTVDLSIPKLGKKAGEWLKNWIIERKEEKIQEVLPVSYIRGDTIHLPS
ncbi:MAG: LacI family DNA-binding transcriptional regulator [Bacteroidetes bacterium]|nr:LacI family DNA-binding transcriptional regulator [Bacteroidota bacterium]